MIRWFQSKKFAVQLIILAVVFDPLGFASGYVLAPSFDVAPLYGRFEAKASPFRAGMKPTNSIQPPTMAQTGFQRNL
ncbi:hypothetical protein DP106_07255 [Halonotius pteroides]|uniref:DUF8141 domain-containing protein n=1 Tax=Halonotius pteroides TaxID=268735 RepID=A0A3A6PZU1_9EURY|nr:hypothetical protein DP106_07255 [Halonotius pteroides]